MPPIRSTIAVQLSGRCNLTCAYCYQDRRRVRPALRWDDLRTVLDAALSWNPQLLRLEFTGGEPLLEADLLRRAIGYVEAVHPDGTHVEFSITTNGTLLAPDLLPFLASRSFAIRLSHDGVPTAQDRRGRGTFPVLDRLLDTLRERYPDYFRSELKIGMTLVASTVPLLAENVCYFMAKGVPEISISPCSTWDRDWCVGTMRELERQVGAIVRLAEAHWRHTGAVPVKFLARAPLQDANASALEFLCGAPTGMGMCVDPNGTAWACPFFASSLHDLPPLARAASRVLDLGHVADPALAERLAALPEKARTLRIFTDKLAKHSSYGACADCRFAADCHVCPASICHIPGNRDPDLIPDFLCAFNEVTLRARERFDELTAGQASAAWFGSVSRALRDLGDAIEASSAGARRTPPGRAQQPSSKKKKRQSNRAAPHGGAAGGKEAAGAPRKGA